MIHQQFCTYNLLLLLFICVCNACVVLVKNLISVVFVMLREIVESSMVVYIYLDACMWLLYRIKHTEAHIFRKWKTTSETRDMEDASPLNLSRGVGGPSSVTRLIMRVAFIGHRWWALTHYLWEVISDWFLATYLLRVTDDGSIPSSFMRPIVVSVA